MRYAFGTSHRNSAKPTFQSTQKRFQAFPILPYRKAMTLEAVAVLILFGLIFSLLLIYIGNQTLSTSQTGSRNLCRQSVMIHAGKPLEVFRGSITCPPEHIRITGQLSDPTSQLHAKLELAKSLYHCWQDFGEGKRDLFTRQGTYCTVCSYIDFDDKKGAVTGLTLYLGNTTIPYRDISFLDYFSGYQTPHFRDYMNNPALYRMAEAAAARDIPDTSQRYATILVYARGEDAINRLKDNQFLVPIGEESGGRLIGVGTAGVMGGAGGIIGSFLLLGTGPAGWITAALSSVTISGITMYSLSTFTDKPQWLTFPRIMPYTPLTFQRLGCEALPVKTK